jgi:hypothetical protein
MTAADPDDHIKALSKEDLDYAGKFRFPYWKGLSADHDS